MGWYDPSRWDPKDSRRKKCPWRSIEETRSELESQAASLCARPEVDEVRAYVLDCSAR